MVKIFDMHADLGLMLAKRKQPDQKAYFREVNLPEWQANGAKALGAGVQSSICRRQPSLQ